MTRYCKRLIEVDLPIKLISAHAREEKDSRRGHIPRLHIYPAARPCAACRATILAAMLPDPGSIAESSPPHDSHSFLSAAKRAMINWADRGMKLASNDSFKILNAIASDARYLDHAANLRSALLAFVADFANPRLANDPLCLETARSLVTASHQSLGGNDGRGPFALDPFAGGGAIPLESSRLGLYTYANDLNPLSVLLNTTLLQIVPRFGERILGDVVRWVAWAGEKARQRLTPFYPSVQDGTRPVVYLWARTGMSIGPSDLGHPIEIPLLKTMLLTRNTKRLRALRWKRDGDGGIVLREVQLGGRRHSQQTILRPELEVFVPSQIGELDQGTVRGRVVTCPVTGFPMSLKDIQSQLAERDGGGEDSRLYCVVYDSDDGNPRDYRAPDDVDIEAATSAIAELRRRFGNDCLMGRPILPTEPTPIGGGRGAGRAFYQRSYGMKQFKDLFIPRQLLALLTYAELAREYVEQISIEHGREYADSVSVLLGLLVDRLADLNSSLCVWQLNTPNNAHVFGRWVLQVPLDFAEVNPLAEAGGSPESASGRMVSCLRELSGIGLLEGIACQGSADSLPLPDDSVDLVFTDPPYYDAVPYSDLLDYFYVWLKRTVSGSLSNMFRDELCPKDMEYIVDEKKGKTPEYFEKHMTGCFLEARRVLSPSGIGIVVFAHKSTEGWENMIEALVEAGWTITASWPIDSSCCGKATNGNNLLRPLAL